jgi:hypothetical protein
LHETHAPVQAVTQQTPSAQWFERQSLSSRQPAPLSFCGRLPQLPFVQTAGEAHSPPPVVHVDAQAADVPAITQL